MGYGFLGARDIIHFALRVACGTDPTLFQLSRLTQFIPVWLIRREMSQSPDESVGDVRSRLELETNLREVSQSNFTSAHHGLTPLVSHNSVLNCESASPSLSVCKTSTF